MEERQNIPSREDTESQAQFRKLEGHVKGKSQGKERQKSDKRSGIVLCNRSRKERVV